ncbi:MAG: acyl-CoA dehydrogenase family protein [Pseudonocardiaceae bacterium]
MRTNPTWHAVFPCCGPPREDDHHRGAGAGQRCHGQSGLHGFSFGELVFEDCRIPAGNRLGEEGQGLDVAYSSSVLYGRPNLTAVALGIHRAIVEDTVRFCTQERVMYGKPLAQLPTVNDKLGRMQSQLMTARPAAYHAVHLLDRGLPCDTELINAKLVNTEYMLDSARTAMEIFAARGLQASYSIERYLRDAHHVYAPAGTSDIQRLRLGQAAIGAYGQQWSVVLADKVSCNPPADVARRLGEPIRSTGHVGWLHRGATDQLAS